MKILVRKTKNGFDVVEGDEHFRSMLAKQEPVEVFEVDTGERFVVHEVDGQIVAVDSATHDSLNKLVASAIKDAALPRWQWWLRKRSLGWLETLVSIGISAFQALVIGPAIVVATVLAIGYVVAGVRLHDITKTYYDYAESAMRSAPAGFVHHRECITSSRESLQCDQTKIVEVPIETEIESTYKTVSYIYWLTVAFSVAVLAFRGKPTRISLSSPARGHAK